MVAEGVAVGIHANRRLIGSVSYSVCERVSEISEGLSCGS